MAITIQELLASDTISQVVNKINFNFDQLLLNGGGPLGPAGPLGPPGPIGGRGERGTEWYEGTDDPNVTAPTLTPLTADYYLQSNGDVWEFTGLTWTNTGINLTGPAGPTGSSGGWDFFGNSPYGTYSATAQNVAYPALMAPGQSTINTNNQGVRTFAVGIAGPNDSPTYGFSVTPAFKLNTTIAGALDASILSMLIHQKDSSATAIRFMGGGEVVGDKYEQTLLSDLSSISLGVDDRLNISVPKAATTPGNFADTVGLNIYTTNRGQEYRAGNHIGLFTGTKGSSGSVYDTSDLNITLNALSGANLPKLNFNSIGTGANTVIQSGGSIVIPAAGTLDGITFIHTGEFAVRSSLQSTIRGVNFSEISSGNNSIKAASNGLSLNAVGNNPIGINAQNGVISLDSSNDIEIESSTSATIKAGGSVINVDTGSIELRGGGSVTQSVLIKAVTSGSGVGIYSSETGGVFMGVSGTGYNFRPSIDLRSDQPNPVMNLRGRIQYARTGTVSNTNATAQNIFIESSAGSNNPTGTVITRYGNSSTFLNGNVALGAYHDYTNSSVWIAKASYNPQALYGNSMLGIYVNNDETFPQGGGSNPGSSSKEMFRVDEKSTSISNRMIWGGPGGVQELAKDLFEATLFGTNIIPTSPYLRIVVAPTANGSYTYLNYTNGFIDSPQSVASFELDAPPLWAEGQRIHVELISISGEITLTGATSVQLSGGTNLRFRWVNQVANNNDAYSTYIQTGAPTIFGGTPSMRRVSFTLQWSGWTGPVYSTNQGGSLSSYGITQGWMLVGPVSRLTTTVNSLQDTAWETKLDLTNYEIG